MVGRSLCLADSLSTMSHIRHFYLDIERSIIVIEKTAHIIIEVSIDIIPASSQVEPFSIQRTDDTVRNAIDLDDLFQCRFRVDIEKTFYDIVPSTQTFLPGLDIQVIEISARSQ